MLLSNRPTLYVLTCIFALFSLSCGSGPATQNSNLALSPSSQSEFPFSTKEPETFQAEFVVTSGGSAKRWFLARDGSRWRFDIYKGAELASTQLRTDKVYLIDHLKKIYSEETQTPGIREAPDPILSAFYRGREFHKFEAIGSGDGLAKYRVVPGEDSKEDIFIYIDEPSGMIVKQEFYAGAGDQASIAYLYEVRGLKLSVDDGVFDLPNGYRLVKLDEFQQARGTIPSGR